MPKNKRQKYQRVKDLPNVTITEWGIGTPPSPKTYPWNDGRYAGMKILLELGCGKGEHSLAFAEADPGLLCIGVDRKSHRICVGAEQAIAMGLENIQFLRAQIEDVETFFRQGAIDDIWLTFPDPHPKLRTSHLRMTSPEFLDRYARLLAPGGMVHLKTDSTLLFEYTRETVSHQGGHVLKATENLHAMDNNRFGARNVISAFEQEARARGETVKYLCFELKQEKTIK